MANTNYTGLVIVMMIFFFLRMNVDLSVSEKKILELYNTERNRFRSVLFNSTYKSGYGNITGFQLSYGDALNGYNVSDYPIPGKNYNDFKQSEEYSVLPNYVSSLANEIWNPNDFDGKVIKNLTGVFKGLFTVSPQNFTPIDMALPSYLLELTSEFPSDSDPEEGIDTYNSHSKSADPYIDDALGFAEDSFAENHFEAANSSDFFDNFNRQSGNFRAVKAGRFDLHFKASRNDENQSYFDVIPITAGIDMTDDDEDIRLETIMNGYYFPSDGAIFTSTSSAKFESSFAMPHLLLNEEKYSTVKQLIINKHNFYEKIDPEHTGKLRDVPFYELSHRVRVADKCEYLGYFKLKSMNLSHEQLQLIDDELYQPLGRPIPKLPKLNIERGVLYSPDCGVMLEFKDVEGLPYKTFLEHFRHVVIGLTLVFLAQIYLVIRQMNRSNTLVSLSRLSYYTVFLFAIVDAMTFFILIDRISFSDLYISLSVGISVGLVLSWLFELKYAIRIYVSQLNERDVSLWNLLRGRPIDDEDNETLPVTENQAPRPQLDEASATPAICMVYFFLFTLAYFHICLVVSWKQHLRSVSEMISFFLINSYWYPQIGRNIIRGSRTGFSWEFMIGVSVVRLIPVFYLYGNKNNIFHHHTDYGFLAGLTSYVGLSLLLLYVQEKFGPRALIPARLLPTIHSYPELTVEEVEGDLLKNKKKITVHKDGHIDQDVYKLNCAICFNEVEIPVQYELQQELAASEEDGLLSKEHYKKTVVPGDYMVTPCKHIFHEKCLQSWMRYKLKCPICRTHLPSV